LASTFNPDLVIAGGTLPPVGYPDLLLRAVKSRDAG